MSFWTYMLRCADDSFYIGHTDNLEARLDAHHAGSVAGYTSTRHPVVLVWNQEFVTREEALGAERQVKGWNRAKKRALISSDWKTIQILA
jgi:predicted GIY-YIG superfamily endonuclease